MAEEEACQCCGTRAGAFLNLVARKLKLLPNSQVANEINARRINDEYDFFSGLGTNAIFLGVLVITMGLQVGVGSGAREGQPPFRPDRSEPHTPQCLAVNHTTVER